jgi:hypothetical protein
MLPAHSLKTLSTYNMHLEPTSPKVPPHSIYIEQGGDWGCIPDPTTSGVVEGGSVHDVRDDHCISAHAQRQGQRIHMAVELVA